MTPAELRAIEQRANAATEGPWAWEWTGGGSWCLGLVDPVQQGEIREWFNTSTNKYEEKPIVVACVAENGVDASRADAEFIAHARHDIPLLIKEIRVLWAERERLRLEKREL